MGIPGPTQCKINRTLHFVLVRAFRIKMGAGGSKSEKETVIEFFPELEGWIPCPGIGNGDFFPGKAILCKTNRCSSSGQILLDTRNPTLRFEGGLDKWPDIQRRHVNTVDNSPQQMAFTFTKGDDINVWLSAYANLHVAGGEKSTKEYKMLFEHTKKLSVDIEHFQAVFHNAVIKQATDGIKGETSFFVVTDVFEVGKARCQNFKRTDRLFEASLKDQKGSGVELTTNLTSSMEASQCSETPIALYMKCAEVKYDNNTRKITEIEGCDASTFRSGYTLMDSMSHFQPYQRANNDIIIAYKVMIYSGTKTSADVFLRLVDQDSNWSNYVRISNPWWRRQFTADGVYSKVIGVQYRDTGGRNNNGQSAGDVVSMIKVWHDNSGFSPGWFLHKVVLQNLKTGLLQEFPFYRWLSRRRDDNRIAREMTMRGSEDGQVRIYKVRVTTVDKWRAASASPVIVRLQGSLRHSESIQVMGELKRGRETEFTIVAAHLGELQGVELSLRSKGHWLLEKVEVHTCMPGSPPLASPRRGTWISKSAQMFTFAGAVME